MTKAISRREGLSFSTWHGGLQAVGQSSNHGHSRPNPSSQAHGLGLEMSS